MKRQQTKAQRIAAAKKANDDYYRKLGFKGGNKGKSIYEIPDYSTDSLTYTSNEVPDSGAKTHKPKYSGDEILGIVETHKSNAMPIRKDNRKAAVDAANMRRN